MWCRTISSQVLKVKVHFSQAVPFEDADMLERIHLNYRLQYLKDIVLPRLLDDGAFVSLTQMIHSNLSIILDYLQKNAQLLDRLFVQLQQGDLQSLLFLQDICRLAKQIPPAERQALHEKMVERKLMEVLSGGVSGVSEHAFWCSEDGCFVSRRISVSCLLRPHFQDNHWTHSYIHPCFEMF